MFAHPEVLVVEEHLGEQVGIMNKILLSYVTYALITGLMFVDGRAFGGEDVRRELYDTFEQKQLQIPALQMTVKLRRLKKSENNPNNNDAPYLNNLRAKVIPSRRIPTPQRGPSNPPKQKNNNSYARIALQNFLLNSTTEPVFDHKVQGDGGIYRVAFNNQYYVDPHGDEHGFKVFENDGELNAYNDDILKANHINLASNSYNYATHTEAPFIKSYLPEQTLNRAGGRVPMRRNKKPYRGRNTTPSPRDQFKEAEFKSSGGYFTIDEREQKDQFYVDYDYDYLYDERLRPPAMGYSQTGERDTEEKSEETLEEHLQMLKENIQKKLDEIGLLGKIQKPCFSVTPGEGYAQFPPYPTAKLICP